MGNWTFQGFLRPRERRNRPSGKKAGPGGWSAKKRSNSSRHRSKVAWSLEWTLIDLRLGLALTNGFEKERTECLQSGRCSF